jgi:hypothetical protein
MKKNKDKLFLMLLPFFFLSIILVVIKINWSWVDDVFYANNFQSLTTDLPIYDPDYFVGLSKVFILLFNFFPNIGWLGFFLMSLMLAVFLLSNFLLVKGFNVIHLPKYKQVLYCLVIASIFSTFFFRLNFTVTCILSVSIGLLFFEYNQGKKIAVIGVVLFMLGLLIRWHVALIFIVIHLFYLLIKYYKRGNFKSQVKRNLIVQLLAIVIFASIYAFTFNEDVIELHETTPFEWMAQDMYALSFIDSETLTEEDKFKLNALRSWNTQDGEVLDKRFYKVLYDKGKLTYSSILGFLKNKLELAVYFSSRYVGDSSPLNWSKKFLGLLTLLVFLSFIHFRGKRHVVFLVGSLSILFLILILIKSEERVAIPFLIIVSMYLIMVEPNINRNNYNKTANKALLIGVFSFATFLLINNYNQSRILLKDLKTKSIFIDELNNSINNKIVLFDAFTPYMLQTSPFKTVKLNPSNNYSLALHYGRNNFASVNNRFSKEKTSRTTYINTFEEIEKRKEDVIFIYTKYNIEFLTEWNKYFYNRIDSFDLLFENSVLSNGQNSYLWNEMEMDYYQLR